VLLPALTSDAKLGLALTAAVFVAFSLIVALVIPRSRPDFPGKRLPAFLVVSVLLFVAMVSAVLIFGGKTKAETEAAREKIAVGESDYTLEVPKTTISPGLYTLEVTNYGQIPHNLTVRGPDGTKGTRDIQPGESASLPIDFKRGTYVLYSSLPGQQQQGVSETVTVS
jgi:plastocyanin